MMSKQATTRQGRNKRAAVFYKQGLARHAYSIRNDILSGMAKSPATNRTATNDSVCSSCASLRDLRDIFNSFVHTGSDLRRRKAIYSKPTGVAYRDVKKQNHFLRKTVFHARGNYVYHRNCVCKAFGVGTQRLARLRKAVNTETSAEPVELVEKSVISKNHRESDSIHLACRKRPTLHGNSRKQSNNAKSESVLEHFNAFVNSNSTSNGRKEGSCGKTYYFDRKFSQIRTPDVADPQHDYKCKHSVLFEFNRTLREKGLQIISVGTMHNWIKKYFPYVGICPSLSDYCDRCKELGEEISRCRQIINRLIQSGNTPPG